MLWGETKILGCPGCPGTVDDTAEFESNLAALCALLGEQEPGTRLLKAEAARELGRFEQCRTLLDFDFPSYHGPYVKTLLGATRQSACRCPGRFRLPLRPST